MANSKKKPSKQKNIVDLSDLSMFDRAAKSIFSVLDNGYNDKLLLNSKDQKFRGILNRELDIAKGYSQGSIVDFVSSMKIGKEKTKESQLSNLNPSTNDLFTKNINDIFSYFQDLYRNKFLEINDLKFISRFIPALGEAVKTVLDAIVSSDNIAETVNRTIDLPAGISKEDEVAIRNEIIRIEKETKLLKRLKTIVYKKALVTGTHYVYAVSYDRIFEEYDILKKREKNGISNLNKNQFGNYVNKDNNGKVSESYILGDIDISPAMENVHELLANSEIVNSHTAGQTKLSSIEIQNMMDNFYNSLPKIICESSSIYTDAIDDLLSMMECEGVKESYTAVMEKKMKRGDDTNNALEHNPLELKIPDGTVGTYKDKIRPSKFNVHGTYIKYIDSKNIIPLKVFDQTIGYYLIHPKAKRNMNSAGEVTGINSIGNTLFSAVNIGEAKKHDAVQRIVDSISEGIINNFDKRFVTKNANYKKLIADVIIANGLTDKDYNIQFIPESDIIPFTIQENEDGFGESILSDSLFPAKLLLSMIVTRMLNYINKTGNKTIAHIHRGPVNAYDSNQLQRVIRDLQDQDVTFNDLLSPNLVFNKFNRDGNMVIPTSRNDNRLVEFETQEGQQIDMNPEYEKELETMAILGTGVPSVIMEYAGSADFAKQLVSANIKFAGRVASLQSDLEEPTTLLYKKLCENSNMTDAQKVVCAQSLKIKLPRPRVLTNSNNNEYISNIVQIAESIADAILGRDTVVNTDINPDGPRIKEKLMLRIIKKDTPFIDWEDLEKMVEDVVLEVEEEKLKRPQKEDASGNNSGGAEF